MYTPLRETEDFVLNLFRNGQICRDCRTGVMCSLFIQLQNIVARHLLMTCNMLCHTLI